MTKKSSNNTCLYVGLGCGGAILLGALVLGGLGWWGVQKAKQFEAELKDPEARSRKVHQVLGADTLPDGYYPGLGMSVPFVFDMATLSRQPVADGEEPNDMDFIYMRMLRLGKEEQELRDFFNGTNDNPRILRDQNINLNIDDVVERGEIQVANQTILWLTSRERMQAGALGSSDLTTVMIIECPGDKKFRMGIWMEDSEVSNNEDGTPILEGTVGDPAEIEDFMSHFSVC